MKIGKPLKGNKGVTVSVLIGLLLGIVTVIIVWVAFKGVFFAASTTLGDSMCTLNAAARDSFFGVPMALCFENNVKVEADNWKACDPEGEEGWEESYEEEGSDKYLRWCATRQFYTWTDKCWERYGGGDFDLSVTELGNAYPCYKVTVRGLEDDDYIFSEPGTLELRGDFREEDNIDVFEGGLKKSDLRIRGALGNEGNGVYSVYYYEGIEGSVIWVNVWPNPTI